MAGIASAFEPGERVLAAVSGGADSVALLWMLHELQSNGRIELIAAHFDHGIRGEDSRADVDFVRRLCIEMGIRLVEGKTDVRALARDRREGLEKAARDARYTFLREAKEHTGADVIALAHHMDDQAETVLMHLLRGCGPGGLAGMRARQGDLVRPLLGYRKHELSEYLTSRGLSWREDATNRVPDNPRNALRLDVFPSILRVYPGATPAIARHARLAADEDDLVRSLAADFLRERLTPLPLGGWALTLEPPPHSAILRRVIHEASGLDANWVERLMALARDGGAVEPPGGLRAESAEGRLFVFPRVRHVPRPVILPAKGRAELSGLCAMLISDADPLPERNDIWSQVLRARALTDAQLRTRREGDYIRPLGVRGRQSLSDYLINRHVPRALRDLIPLIAVGSEVLWVVGVGISETAAINDAQAAKRLTFEGEKLR